MPFYDSRPRTMGSDGAYAISLFSTFLRYQVVDKSSKQALVRRLLISQRMYKFQCHIKLISHLIIGEQEMVSMNFELNN